MSTLKELERAQVSPRLLEILRRQGFAGLTEFQLSAVEKGVVIGNSQLLLTQDYGEAYEIAEIAALNRVMSHFKAKALIICPNPHLAEKRHHTVSQKCSRLGIETSAITRRRIATSSEKIRGRVIVATFNSLAIAMRTHPYILDDIECVLIERLDLIGQPSLGAKLETAIVTLMRSNPQLQFISICPPVEDVEELSSWLNAEIITDPESEVKIIFSVKAFENVQASLTDLTQFVHNKRGQIMILCPDRFEASKLASQLAGVGNDTIPLDLRLPLGHQDELEDLAKEVLSFYPKCDASKELARTITSGIAYFHEGVSRAQRRTISKAWENELLPVIIMPIEFAIASGLRATVVFLMGVFMRGAGGEEKPDENLTMLSEWQFNDVLQSAGRRGIDNEAFAIVVVDNESERQRVLAKFFSTGPQGDISPRLGEVDSSMDNPENSQDLVLGQLCGEDTTKNDHPFSILGRTFWAASNRSIEEDSTGLFIDPDASIDILVLLRATKSTVRRAEEIPKTSVKLVSANPDKLEGLIHSHSRDLWHHVILRAKEGVSCTCESWKYQGIRKHRLCKHLVRFVTYVTQKDDIASYSTAVVKQALRGLEILDDLEKDGLITKVGDSIKCTSLGESVTVLGIPVRDAKRVVKAISDKDVKLHDVIHSMIKARSNLDKAVIERVLESTAPGVKGEIEYCEDDVPGIVENCLEEIQYINSILLGLVSPKRKKLRKEIDALEERVQFLLKSIS
ncbi:MAG: hypothetical protein ACTSU3_06550 [Candidatus Thorarchaeota archaeon]